jgi:HlyD family secretion protein
LGGGANLSSFGKSREDAASVWVQRDAGIVSTPIKTGLSDGVNVIVKDGVRPGDRVILSAAMDAKDARNGTAANPLMPRPQRRR